MFGPPGLFYRGKQFGTKIVKKMKPSIEAGQRIRPEAQCDDVYVVVGILVSPTRSRRTEIEILLLKERGSAEFHLMHYDLTAKFSDQPDRFGLDTTLSSLEEALLGRALASSLGNSGAPIHIFSEADVIGNSTRSYNKKVFLCLAIEMYNHIDQKRCNITSVTTKKKPTKTDRVALQNSRHGRTGAVEPDPISLSESTEPLARNKRRSARQSTAARNTRRNPINADPLEVQPAASETPTRTSVTKIRDHVQHTSDDATNKKFQELFLLMADLGAKIDHVSKRAAEVFFFYSSQVKTFPVNSRKKFSKKHRSKIPVQRKLSVPYWYAITIIRDPKSFFYQDTYDEEIGATPNGKSGENKPQLTEKIKDALP